MPLLSSRGGFNKATIITPLTRIPQIHNNGKLQYLGLEVLEVLEASMVAADIVQRSEIKILLTKRSTVRLQKDRYASDNITLTGKFNIYYSDNTYKLKYSFRVTACQFQVTVTVLDSVLQVAFGL